MCITAQEVRDTSVTGEFDSVSDAVIDRLVASTCKLYASVRAKNIDGWRDLVALHVAHDLHAALVSEGQGGGAVQSESFAQVGSRTYSVADPDSDDWWKGSPYGRRWRRFWDALPPAASAIPGGS